MDPARPVALVIEGGAMRAAYASGVAHALQDAGFRPSAIYGTSAGGAIAAWYAAGQAHVGCRTWESVTDRALLSYRRAFWGDKPILDFRRLYGDFYPNRFGMDLAALRRAPYPVRVSLTDADTAESYYPDLREADDPLLLLHATSALPLVSEAPVTWNGRRVLDGGALDPIPLARALADGHREVVVIANRPPGERKPEHALVVRLVARRFPALERAARDHHALHNAAMRLAERPPEGVAVHLARPVLDTGVSRFTRDVDALRRCIDLGRRDGARLGAKLSLAPVAGAPPVT